MKENVFTRFYYNHVQIIIINNLKKVKHNIVILFFFLFRIFPIQQDKIVISNFAGKGYGSEGRAICEELLKKKTYFDIVWLCNDIKTPVPKGIRVVKYNTIMSIYELVTAKVWIDNRRKDIFVRKRKKQFYIQTWHGSVCIKKVENDADTLPKLYLDKAKADSKMADLFISGSKWRDNNYRSAFWYDGEIIRGDLYKTKHYILNQKAVKQEICNYFNINENVSILLYAPTFRQNSRLDCYNLDYERLLNNVKRRFGGEWVILIRLHPNISMLNEFLEYSNVVLNGTNYPQVYDLISACDILISDYSGVIFDAFRFDKKVFLYASDLEKYIYEERGLYFDFSRLPSPLAKNNEELEDIINQFDESEYINKRNSFVEMLGYYDENAAKIVSDRIEVVVKEI